MIFKRIITLRSIARGVIAGILTTLISSVANAHDIPSQVTLQSFVKPESNQLKVLIRIPMDALSEISFPTRGPGYLLFSEAERTLRDAAQVYVTESIEIYENGLLISEKEVLEIRVSLPSNRSFTSYEQALENIRKEPLEDSINMYWAQGMFDILISYPIQSETSDFSINPGLDRLGVTTTTGIRFLLPGGGERAFTIIGHTGVIVLDPSWSQAFFRFVSMGFSHILDGIDHLLFLFCLVIPLRNIRALIPVITSFTIAHSITLIGSAFGLTPTALWFAPLIETLIALSIVYMAFENIVGAKLEHRWMVTFGFGLVHGFGFSFLFADTLQFAGTHLFTSLLAFNVGVELGQLLVLAIVIPLLICLFRFFVAERVGTILLSALIAHSAWHWMTDRSNTLSQYQFQWPVLDATFYAALMRWTMLLIVVVGVIWLMMGLFNRFLSASATDSLGGTTGAEAEQV